MAFIPQFYTFPIDLTAEFPTPYGNTSVLDNTIMWGQDNNFTPVRENGVLDDHTVSHHQDWDTMSSNTLMPTFSEQKGSVSEYQVDFFGGIAEFPNFSSGYQSQIGEFEEDIKPHAFPYTATENWGLQVNQMPAGEEPNVKVERYSVEERKERILRYLKKRNQRNFSKTIKYACRKTLADRRVRVRGRFARNNELSEQDMGRKNHENNHKEDFYGDDSIQFQLQNDDDDDWLQEATASLVYLSHSSSDDIYSKI